VALLHRVTSRLFQRHSCTHYRIRTSYSRNTIVQEHSGSKIYRRWCGATEHGAFSFCYRIHFSPNYSRTNADCFPRIASSNPCRISAYTTLDVIPHFACRPLIALACPAKHPSASNIDVSLLVQLYFHECMISSLVNGSHRAEEVCFSRDGTLEYRLHTNASGCAQRTTPECPLPK
jgi:hypothetical protein